jgi:CMP/dCMP kinase
VGPIIAAIPEATVANESTRPTPPVRTIAIDGPAASGKSAIGSAVAGRLGYRFVDTGAMYRAVTWLALHRGVGFSDDALSDLAGSVDLAVADAPQGSGETAVLLDGEDATPHLREPSVEANVSLVSRVPGVRAALVRIQRALAGPGGVVMAGRDIGSVVLPDAGCKVYLDASREVRARRRADQMQAAGQEPDFEILLAELARRDSIDSSRATSPLTAAPGAVIINTDDLTVEQVVERVLEFCT